MAIEVDQAFRSSGRKARQRQRARWAGRGLAAAVVLGIVGGIGWLVWPSSGGDLADGPIDAEGEAFAMVDTGEEAAAPIAPAADAFIDLARDPMILRFGSGDAGGGTTVSGSPDFDVGRVGPPSADRLTVFSDRLVRAEQRLNITIPSTREDLALFQARRSEGIAAMAETGPAATAPTAPVGEGTLVTVDGDDGSWGELIGGAEGEGAADEAVYVETVIENTTSLALTMREEARSTLFDDAVVVVRTQRSLADVLTENGFGEEGAAPVVAAAERLLGLTLDLSPGAVVAMRWTTELGRRRLLQLSLYSSDGYLGTLAQVGLGRFERAADPWYDDDLLSRSDTVRSEVVAAGDVRLLDALYSAGIRNGLTTTLVGEMIVMVSQNYDLDRFAAVDDRVTILHTTEEVPGQGGPGQLLYVGIRGSSGEYDCYVTPSDTPAGFGCFDFDATGGAAGPAGQLGGGLIVPVAGTMTSRFGPRNHPILKQVRLHAGIDWAAPTGTPLYAVADGKVSVAGVGGGYGNVVYIDHAGGVQSRYAHLDRFSPLGRAGTQVKQGDVIGFVGTTGRSTGPHLHFEIRVNGTPVDPMTFVGNVPSAPRVASSGGGGSVAGGGAVEALVNQIIQVESAGVATAKNPRSTATGLGQFIESTWLRMMRTYRPDLVASMSRQQLLNLRNDPGLSREMVTNLARENESFLRNRGHQITAGRLYLAHFLGPGGAHTALSSSPSATVLDVMGAAVVRANPFLRGKTIADLTAWSDRKMRGAGSGGGGAPAPSTTVTRVARAIPPEVTAFREAVDAVLAETG